MKQRGWDGPLGGVSVRATKTIPLRTCVRFIRLSAKLHCQTVSHTDEGPHELGSGERTDETLWPASPLLTEALLRCIVLTAEGINWPTESGPSRTGSFAIWVSLSSLPFEHVIAHHVQHRR